MTGLTNKQDLVLTTTAKTLRQMAWLDAFLEEDAGVMGPVLNEAAEAVERIDDPDDLYMICPVCEEVVCDEGCPLADLRAELKGEATR